MWARVWAGVRKFDCSLHLHDARDLELGAPNFDDLAAGVAGHPLGGVVASATLVQVKLEVDANRLGLLA